MRRQTLKISKRYIFPKLKEHENKMIISKEGC
ncbi:MAG: hypothetical protein ACFC03_02885 [Candidatus Malihini olakiniferum]